MKNLSRFKVVGVAAALAASLALSVVPASYAASSDAAAQTRPADIAAALRLLPAARVLDTTRDGLPRYLAGDLGHAGPLPADAALADRQLRGALRGALAALRVEGGSLSLQRARTDAAGNRHFRYQLRHDGLDVVGADLAVHVDGKGTIYAINGAARGDLPARLASRTIDAAAARVALAADARYAALQTGVPKAVYVVADSGVIHRAWQIEASGQRGRDPVRDQVFVDMGSGDIVAVHPQIHTAKNRAVFSANNLTVLPGTLKRGEGAAANADADVNTNYDYLGYVYDAYQQYFVRDSYNNAGAQLRSSIHYSNNYCNAFWNGTQMVYGDGNASQGCLPLARSVDVTAHELTHAVTENESNLTYSGQSGGLNEAMSDIFGAFVEAWVDGGRSGPLAVSADTWKVGEDILPPALRYMNDPAADGVSLDYYTSTAGNADVHYSSGIANLAFYLLSQGGTHPRGKSTLAVTGVGMEKAIRIFYKANVDILTASSNFLAAGNATIQAAQELGYPLADQVSVANAWQAVGVAVSTPGTGGGGGGGTTDTPLGNNVPVPGLAGAAGSQQFFTLSVPAGQATLSFKTSGGTGDVDLYVRQGARPTTTTYTCRGYTTGNNESCTISNPAAGTWTVMLNGYAAYSGVTLTGSYSAAVDDGVPVLANGVAVTGIAGAATSAQYWKVLVPAGRALTIAMSGGTGDADLYTRIAAKPTATVYDCRPFKSGNTESCAVASTQAGYYYVMIRGYSAFSGITLKATY